MPLYDYQCEDHGFFEAVYSIAEKPKFAPCPICGADSMQIITLGHGGYLRPDAPWIRDVSKMFEIDGEPPMNTIGEYRDFLKRNPTIMPMDHHPAIPSKAGDIKTKDSKKDTLSKRQRAAGNALMKHRAITVSTSKQAG